MEGSPVAPVLLASIKLSNLLLTSIHRQITRRLFWSLGHRVERQCAADDLHFWAVWTIIDRQLFYFFEVDPINLSRLVRSYNRIDLQKKIIRENVKPRGKGGSIIMLRWRRSPPSKHFRYISRSTPDMSIGHNLTAMSNCVGEVKFSACLTFTANTIFVLSSSAVPRRSFGWQ